MTFETPELRIVYFDVQDVLTVSPNWDLPVIGEEETTEPTGWETPIYP